jgi:hypothetical protein
MLKKDEVNNRSTGIFDSICSKWPVCITLGTSFFFIIGCYIYHITPWYTLQEIGNQQHQNDLKNDFINYHNNLGIRLLYNEHVDAAKAEFQKVLDVDKLNQPATRYLLECDLYNATLPLQGPLNSTNYDPEITHIQLKTLLNENQTDPLVHFYYGNFALTTLHLPEAASCYSNATKLDPSFAAAYHRLGLVMSLQQQHDLALPYLKTAVNISPFIIMYTNDLADEFYDLKDYKQAFYYYCGAMNINKNVLWPYVGASNSQRCLGHLETARDIQEDQIKLMKENNTKNLTIHQQGLCYSTNSTNLPGYRALCLYSYDEIQYYFYYNIALTYYLLRNETKTQEYLQQAADLHLHIDSESNAKNLLNYDIENLQKARPEYEDKTTEFTNNYGIKYVKMSLGFIPS